MRLKSGLKVAPFCPGLCTFPHADGTEEELVLRDVDLGLRLLDVGDVELHVDEG